MRSRTFYWLVLVLERIPKSGIQESRLFALLQNRIFEIDIRIFFLSAFGRRHMCIAPKANPGSPLFGLRELAERSGAKHVSQLVSLHINEGMA